MSKKLNCQEFCFFQIRHQQVNHASDSTSGYNVYNGVYESYKSATPVAEILNNTFEKLHYGLSKNDHDSLFHL